MAIVGEELIKYVQDQINVRQKAHGSGQIQERTLEDLTYLNSKSAFIKLASGVYVTDEKLAELGFSPTGIEKFGGADLAKNHILFGGYSQITQDPTTQDTSVTQKTTFVESNGAYELNPELGIIPMPGIESLDVKALNRGSLKKANIKIKVQSRAQLAIIDTLYLRLGYTVLIEWGNSLYLDNNGTLSKVLDTVIDNTDPKSPLSFWSDDPSSNTYPLILQQIEEKRELYAGNYDGMLGKVSNFNWTFNNDGSYDVDLTVISLGDVVESLKTNVMANNSTVKFVANPNANSGESQKTTIIDQRRKDNIIFTLLYIAKLLGNNTANKVKDLSINASGFTNGNGNTSYGYRFNKGQANVTQTYTDFNIEYTATVKDTLSQQPIKQKIQKISYLPDPSVAEIFDKIAELNFLYVKNPTGPNAAKLYLPLIIRNNNKYIWNKPLVQFLNSGYSSVEENWKIWIKGMQINDPSYDYSFIDLMEDSGLVGASAGSQFQTLQVFNNTVSYFPIDGLNYTKQKYVQLVPFPLYNKSWYYPKSFSPSDVPTYTMAGTLFNNDTDFTNNVGGLNESYFKGVALPNTTTYDPISGIRSSSVLRYTGKVVDGNAWGFPFRGTKKNQASPRLPKQWDRYVTSDTEKVTSAPAMNIEWPTTIYGVFSDNPALKSDGITLYETNGFYGNPAENTVKDSPTFFVGFEENFGLPNRPGSRFEGVVRSTLPFKQNIANPNDPQFQQELIQATKDIEQKVKEELTTKLPKYDASGKNIVPNSYEFFRFVGKDASEGKPFYWEVTATAKAGTPRVDTTKNPLFTLEVDDKDFFVLNTLNPAEYYIRFGAFLQMLKQKVVYKIKDNKQTDQDKKTPIFFIDNSTGSYVETNEAESTYKDDTTGKFYKWKGSDMVCLPNQISYDWSTCIVRRDSFVVPPPSGSSSSSNGPKATVFPELEPWAEKDNKNTPQRTNVADAMNVYLNFNFIGNCLQSNLDERGNVKVFGLVSSVCLGINKALGGINNLEPVVDEETNTLSIVDTSPKEKLQERVGYRLQLYAYHTFNAQFSDAQGNLFEELVYESTFARKVNLKTAITPEYATMITVGAAANGYVKGIEATAFSRWNEGIQDRFKKGFEPADKDAIETLQSGSKNLFVEQKDVVNSYQEAMAYVPRCFGITE